MATLARNPTTMRLCGRLLILLGIRNELRARRAPPWRHERNRLDFDRTLAQLASHQPTPREECLA
jgi:hypothetical protein